MVSYLDVRRAVGFIGLCLPVVLGPIGWLCGIEIQDNLSSYYHTPLRDVFVGSMCGIGIFLFCYRGYDRIESLTANLCSASAIGVALFPLDPNSDPLIQKSVVGYLHSLSGGVFFLALAFYSLYHFPTSAEDEPEPAPHAAERNLIFRASGVVILLSMLAMGAYLFLMSSQTKARLNDWNFLFWMESIAVWAFSAAWLTKGRAIFTDLAVDLLAVPGRLLKK